MNVSQVKNVFTKLHTNNRTINRSVMQLINEQEWQALPESAQQAELTRSHARRGNAVPPR
ncbi:MAG: hypothetical protein RLZ75_3309 [Pseudomonadota bacterium]